ncbi:MAG: type III secretion system export apparatus subunit SctS [Gammaproteobacteria bacterium]
MTAAEIINHGTQALILVLLLSLPTIVVAAVVGTLVSLIQALTQVQEQTISFAFKLLAVILMLIVTSRWVGSELMGYGEQAFKAIAEIHGTAH